MPVGIGTATSGAGTLLLAAALVGGAFVYDMGAVYVSVKGKKPGGENVRLILPAVVAPAGVWLAPKKDLGRALKDARPYLPAIQAATEELGNCPDFTLVEVTSAQEKVHVAKQGSHLVIDVDNLSETVHVSLPLRAVGTVASQLRTIPLADEASSKEPDSL